MRVAAAAPLLLAAAAYSQTPTLSTAPVIAEIRVDRTNVFDPAVPGEDIWMFRMADRIHIITREGVVRRELLFSPGEPWDPLKIIESERNLRSNGSFRRAEIVPAPRPDGRVDALVHTQDSWTTNPRVGIGTEGGQSFLTYGIEEGNVLGRGKSVSVFHTQNGPKRSNTVSYGDPRFLGSRLGLGGSYSRTQDGDQYTLGLARPFYSLDSDNAVSYSWQQTHGDSALVQDGSEFSKFFVRRRLVDAAYGKRLGGDRLFVQRLEAGWYADRVQFSPTGDTVAGTLPADHELSGPTLGYSWVQPRYVKETYIDRIERVEDFNLGNELRLRGGFMAQTAGADRDRWIFNAFDQQGFSISPGRFALAGVGASGRLAGGRWENGLLTAGFNVFWKNRWAERDRTLVLHVEGSYGRFLDRENQIVLGGNSGLRGYKNDSFAGGKSVLVNLEDRFFFDREWFHLLRFGGAVFMDTGAVAPEGSGISAKRFKTDVGFGLRTTSTRSRSGGVVRLDLAYALNGGPGGSRWVVSLRAGQAFSFFNSASARVGTSPSSRL